MSSKKQKVIVGMSGGVDSSVAAWLLLEQGYDVVGVFMKNWSDSFALKGGECPWEQDHADALKVADQLGIKLYSLNFEQEYKEKVIDYFFTEYKAGRTPNPDIMCNSEIKFKLFFEKALELGADYIATGHYARVEHGAAESKLLKGVDKTKDQSYFLYRIPQAALRQTLFPLGDREKTWVRAQAHKLGLVTRDKKDSQGICFIGEVDLREFLSQYITDEPGDIIDLETKQVVGRHTGLAWYTIGQRKGMQVGGTGLPLYVAEKDLVHNILYVVKGNYNPALFKNTLQAEDMYWIADIPDLPKRLQVKIRYRQDDQAGEVAWGQHKESVHVAFDKPQRAVTPGQSVVLYDGEYCLGGAIII